MTAPKHSSTSDYGGRCPCDECWEPWRSESLPALNEADRARQKEPWHELEVIAHHAGAQLRRLLDEAGSMLDSDERIVIENARSICAYVESEAHDAVE